MAARVWAGVSPVRTATVSGGGSKPCWRATSAISARGRSRFSAMSVASAFSGDTYTTWLAWATVWPLAWRL